MDDLKLVNELLILAQTLSEERVRTAQVTYDRAKMVRVVDNFVRFLVGDPQAALSKLRTIGNPDVMGVGEMEAANKNKLYDALFDAMMMAVKRTLR